MNAPSYFLKLKIIFEQTIFTMESKFDKLEKLHSLKEKRILTDAEYEKEKQKILEEENLISKKLSGIKSGTTETVEEISGSYKKLSSKSRYTVLVFTIIALALLSAFLLKTCSSPMSFFNGELNQDKYKTEIVGIWKIESAIVKKDGKEINILDVASLDQDADIEKIRNLQFAVSNSIIEVEGGNSSLAYQINNDIISITKRNSYEKKDFKIISMTKSLIKIQSLGIVNQYGGEIFLGFKKM